MRLSSAAPVLVRPRIVDGRATAGGDSDYDTQVGLASPVVLCGLGPDERRFVASLESGRSVTSAEAARFATVIGTLERAGAITHEPREASDSSAAAAPLPERGAVVVADRGPLADLVAEACTAALLAIHPASEAPPHALVVVSFMGAPEARLAQRLMLDGTPHILVACDEAGAWVSHVVVPGTTACGRCRDIALTRADPAWPYLAAQLSGSPLPSRRPAPPLLAPHAAALRVAARALGFAAHGQPGVGEFVGPDAAVTEAPVAAAAECGCGAAGPVGDELAAWRARWPT